MCLIFVEGGDKTVWRLHLCVVYDALPPPMVR